MTRRKRSPARRGCDAGATGRPTSNSTKLTIATRDPQGSTAARLAAAHRAAAPRITELRQFPLPDERGRCCWFVTLADAGMVMVTTSELQSYGKFRRVCREELGVELAPMSTEAWFEELDEALRPLRDGKAVRS